MSFGRKNDWRRHEEQHHPQEGWICDLDATAIVNSILTCSYCDTHDPEVDHAVHNHQKRVAISHCKNKPLDARGRIFYRKEHYLHHLDKNHPSIPSAEQVSKNHFVVDSSFPRGCGFCVQYQFGNWQDRIEHLGHHFENGENMSSWKPPNSGNWQDEKDSKGKDTSLIVIGQDSVAEKAEKIVEQDEEESAGESEVPKQRLTISHGLSPSRLVRLTPVKGRYQGQRKANQFMFAKIAFHQK